MAVVYILYSSSLSKFYTGSCYNINERFDQHLSKIFPAAFTASTEDWTMHLLIDGLEYLQARKIELHIKRMKSKKFIENLKKYPELVEKIIQLYQ
jgi:putative endonuclease